MQELSGTADLVAWTPTTSPLPTLDERLLRSLSKIGVPTDSRNAQKLNQALVWADVELDQYQLVAEHTNLPTWWTERNNKLFVPVGCSAEKLPSIGFHSGVPTPENCVIFLSNTVEYSILLWGSHTLLYISPTARIPAAHVAVGNGFVFIGPDVRSTARLNINCRNEGSVVLTKDILLGSDVRFQSDDCHTIISTSSNARINPYGGTIVVKNHVWFGENVLVMGDSCIAENSVIGARAFVRGVLTPPNAIIAGVPARVTRSGITWDSRDLPPDHPNLG